jgi:hypothetical protein
MSHSFSRRAKRLYVVYGIRQTLSFVSMVVATVLSRLYRAPPLLTVFLGVATLASLVVVISWWRKAPSPPG